MSYNIEYIEAHGQYIKNLSLDVPNAPYIFSLIDSAPEVDVKCNVDAVKINENNTYEVTISVSVEAKIQTSNEEKKIAFICDLKYSGIFVVGEKTEDEIRRMMLVDAAFLLFPFARNRIADVVMSAGFPPLVLAPINFAERYNQSEGSVQ